VFAVADGQITANVVFADPQVFRAFELPEKIFSPAR
jgi:hypothetical protein